MQVYRTVYKVSFLICMVLLTGTCQLFTGGGDPIYKENNPDGFNPVELFDSAEGGNLFRLSFGTSSRAAGDLAKNTSQGMGVTVNGDGSILLKAVNTSNNAGKIAGSEDGITYFYTEVDRSKNFRLSADFEVHTFGFSNGKTDLNGQEAFGLMARDYVPQYPGFSMEEIRYATGGGYYTGAGRPDGPGGSGNMVMIGGVKRGIRMYWRSGVTDPVGDACDNPDTVADASKAKFSFMPRELPDYSKWANTSERTDFPAGEMLDLGGGRLALPGGGLKSTDYPPVAGTGTRWHLYLEKTNNGFIGRMSPLPYSGGPDTGKVNKGIAPNKLRDDVIIGETYEYELAEPDLVAVSPLHLDDPSVKLIKPDTYYVGFFACRDAMVTVTNISYAEVSIEDSAPQIEPDPASFAPTFEIVSPQTVSTASYTLYGRSNVEGIISVSLNGNILQSRKGVWTYEKTNASAVPFSLFEVPVTGLGSGDNVFKVVFTPVKTQDEWNKYYNPSGRPVYEISNYAAINKTFLVNRKMFNGDTIWVGSNGRPFNEGTYDSPLDIDTAIAYVQPGQTIKMKNGVYTPLRIMIPRYNDGTQDKPKRLVAEERDKVVIDFKKNYYAKGIDMNGSYWELEGFHIINTPNKIKGINVAGSNNKISWLKTYFNGDTGIQIAGSSADPKNMWPRDNRVEYCESFANMDASREDADGFASKLTSGEGNVFYWCIAHHNADDGWDLFSKKETGNIGAVLLDHCIAYSNGRFLQTGDVINDDGILVHYEAETSTRSGGNGFKMGGEGLSVLHHAIDCLSFNNDADGFTSNSDPAILLTHCTSFNNGRTVEENMTTRPGNYAIYGAGSAGYEGLDAVVSQIVSLYTEDGNEPRSSERVQLRSPASGYKWDPANGGTYNTSGRILRVIDSAGSLINVENAAPPFTANGIAPWCNAYTGSIAGAFLTVDQTSGKYILNKFAQLKNIIGAVPGARGLWDN